MFQLSGFRYRQDSPLIMKSQHDLARGFLIIFCQLEEARIVPDGNFVYLHTRLANWVKCFNINYSRCFLFPSCDVNLEYPMGQNPGKKCIDIKVQLSKLVVTRVWYKALYALRAPWSKVLYALLIIDTFFGRDSRLRKTKFNWLSNPSVELKLPCKIHWAYHCWSKCETRLGSIQASFRFLHENTIFKSFLISVLISQF